MLKIEELNVSYNTAPVLQNANAQFATGNVTGIIGLNGAGKTTLFNSIAGIIKIQSGRLLLNGNPLHHEHIAYLETVNYFYPLLTGREYLSVFDQTNIRYKEENLQLLLHLPLNERIENYSTGMRKKLALMALLKQEKSVYIFDEPFNGLDLESNKLLELMINNLKEQGKTILLSSHILDPLLQVCNTILLLEQGRFVKSYSPDEFHTIEEALFSHYKKQAAQQLQHSM